VMEDDMATSQPEFVLCEQCLSAYQELRFDENAELQQNVIPYATIMWTDEHPEGIPKPLCESRSCHNSVAYLIAARSEYWDSGAISPRYARVWRAAKDLLPAWPGFRRLEVTNEQRKLLDVCLQNAEAWFEALAEYSRGNVSAREIAPGIFEWSATIDLTGQEEE